MGFGGKKYPFICSKRTYVLVAVIAAGTIFSQGQKTDAMFNILRSTIRGGTSSVVQSAVRSGNSGGATGLASSSLSRSGGGAVNTTSPSTSSVVRGTATSTTTSPSSRPTASSRVVYDTTPGGTEVFAPGAESRRLYYGETDASKLKILLGSNINPNARYNLYYDGEGNSIIRSTELGETLRTLVYGEIIRGSSVDPETGVGTGQRVVIAQPHWVLGKDILASSTSSTAQSGTSSSGVQAGGDANIPPASPITGLVNTNIQGGNTGNGITPEALAEAKSKLNPVNTGTTGTGDSSAPSVSGGGDGQLSGGSGSTQPTVKPGAVSSGQLADGSGTQSFGGTGSGSQTGVTSSSTQTPSSTSDDGWKTSTGQTSSSGSGAQSSAGGSGGSDGQNPEGTYQTQPGGASNVQFKTVGTQTEGDLTSSPSTISVGTQTDDIITGTGTASIGVQTSASSAQSPDTTVSSSQTSGGSGVGQVVGGDGDGLNPDLLKAVRDGLKPVSGSSSSSTSGEGDSEIENVRLSLKPTVIADKSGSIGGIKYTDNKGNLVNPVTGSPSSGVSGSDQAVTGGDGVKAPVASSSLKLNVVSSGDKIAITQDGDGAQTSGTTGTTSQTGGGDSNKPQTYTSTLKLKVTSTGGKVTIVEDKDGQGSQTSGSSDGVSSSTSIGGISDTFSTSSSSSSGMQSSRRSSTSSNDSEGSEGNWSTIVGHTSGEGSGSLSSAGNDGYASLSDGDQGSGGNGIPPAPPLDGLTGTAGPQDGGTTSGTGSGDSPKPLGLTSEALQAAKDKLNPVGEPETRPYPGLVTPEDLENAIKGLKHVDTKTGGTQSTGDDKDLRGISGNDLAAAKLGLRPTPVTEKGGLGGTKITDREGNPIDTPQEGVGGITSTGGSGTQSPTQPTTGTSSQPGGGSSESQGSGGGVSGPQTSGTSTGGSGSQTSGTSGTTGTGSGASSQVTSSLKLTMQPGDDGVIRFIEDKGIDTSGYI